jgi:hypothetical protein
VFAPLVQGQFDYPMPAGQYSGLAATDDGLHLYFSTTLRLKESDGNVYQKIMRFVGQFEAYREVEPEGTPPEYDRGNFFRLIYPQVSGDGSVVAYTASRVCTCCSSCLSIPRLQSVIAGKHAGPDRYDYARITLSGNGRYALLTGDGGFLNVRAVVDLSTGGYTSLGDAAPFNGQVITDDGSVLLSIPNPLGNTPQVVLRGFTSSFRAAQPLANAGRGIREPKRLQGRLRSG